MLLASNASTVSFLLLLFLGLFCRLAEKEEFSYGLVKNVLMYCI